MEEVPINDFDFQAEDIALGGSIENDSIYKNTIEHQEIALNFEDEKQCAVNNCSNELQCCKIDMTSSVATDDEEENIIKQTELDGKILFEFNGEEYRFKPNDIGIDGKGFDKNFISIEEKNIKTGSGDVFIIKDGNIYDWKQSIDHHKNMTDQVFGYSDKIRIHEAITKGLYSGNQKYDFENLDRNINLLSSLKFLGLAQNTENPIVKNEYLSESVGFYNLAVGNNKIGDFKNFDVVELGELILDKISKKE